MTVDSSWCTLKVDNDGIYALMCLHTHNGEEEHTISAQLVTDFLESQGVVYGVNSIAIQSMLEHAMYEQYICVARGIPPTKGDDGYYDYQKSTEDMKKKPLINEDGTADYKNSLNLATIKEGELLAIYVPPTDGTPGMNVFGEVVPSKGNGKGLMPLRGKGIVANEDGVSYYAGYSGHIVMDGSKIYIDKLYRVNGDLDIEIGNIRFDGDVEVSGDVRSGLEIEAKGNIYIRGHVGACKITAGKSITIEKGIQGRATCSIEAGEDVLCKFVESCRITAGGSIYADSVLSSVLIANNQVNVTSKNGNVISSEVYGMAGVIIKEAGNTAGMPTLLRAGLPREYYTRAASLAKMIQDNEAKINSFNQHLETLEKNIAEDKAIAETRTQIMRAKIVLNSNNNEYKEELQSLDEKIKADVENSYINVLGTVYDGVRVYIGTYPYLVMEPVKEVTFKVTGNEVIMCPLEEK